MDFTFSLPAAVFRPGHYTGFYLLAIATYQALLLWEGRRRSYPLRPWLLMQAATLLAFVVGCKLVVLHLGDWPALWHGAALPVAPVRSALGGVAASGLVLLGLRRWLGMPWAAFDAFVGPLAAGLAVQCLGCLAAGCCWGEPAAGGPGLCFGPDTAAYAAQVAAGQLPAGAAHSLPVVPVQLYALFISLGFVVLTYAPRCRAWPGSTAYLLGTGGLLLAWAALGQWRDPLSQTLGAVPLTLGGLRLLTLQWVLLATGLLSWAGAALRWRCADRSASPAPPAPARPGRQLLGAGLLLVLTGLLAPQALTGAEFRVLQMALGAVLLAEVAAVLNQAAGPVGVRGRRLAPALAPTLLLLAGLLSSQAPAPVGLPPVQPDSVRLLEVTVGGTSGGFDQDENFAPTTSGGGCGGGGGVPVPATRDGYRHRYRAGGGQVSYQLRPGGRGIVGTLGLGVWGGTDEVAFARQRLTGELDFPANAPRTRYELFDLNPFVEGWYAPLTDRPNFGFGYRTGLHFGNLLNTEAQRGDSLLRQPLTVLPEVQLWLGDHQRLFGLADAGYGAGATGNYYYRLGLGTGLGGTSTLQAGVAWAAIGRATTEYRTTTREPTPLGFVAASLVLANGHLRLEPTALAYFGMHYQVSVRLHYRLPAK